MKFLALFATVWKKSMATAAEVSYLISWVEPIIILSSCVQIVDDEISMRHFQENTPLRTNNEYIHMHTRTTSNICFYTNNRTEIWLPSQPCPPLSDSHAVGSLLLRLHIKHLLLVSSWICIFLHLKKTKLLRAHSRLAYFIVTQHFVRVLFLPYAYIVYVRWASSFMILIEIKASDCGCIWSRLRQAVCGVSSKTMWTWLLCIKENWRVAVCISLLAFILSLPVSWEVCV